MLRFLFILLWASLALAVDENYTTVNQDKAYFTRDSDNTRIIFSEEYSQFAEHTINVEQVLQPAYQASFGYAMDRRLYVGLLSSRNQIANGFSTQFPLNQQMNYGGGALMVDYFSSASWLDTLLWHETAHNYQLNAKDNWVSKSLFAVLGNGNLLFPFVPATLPNLTESSFILEGNAVLNESWQGNGGRLYSGRYRAMTNVHANAGYLTRQRLYNTTLNFPYGEGHYIFGSQYQYFLAEKYGLDKTNQYFKHRSRYWFWPFMVNQPSRRSFNRENFNLNFAQWVNKTQQQAAAMQMAEGEILASSQYFAGLNRHNDAIFFLAYKEGTRAPLLSRYDRKEHRFSQQRKAFLNGKIFQQDDKLYSATSHNSSVWAIKMGLFDSQARMNKDSKGKIIQGYMQDGRPVYFKADTSFIQPQLYVGDNFYAQVNSSVIVDKDNLYYFVQYGPQRVLYRNQQPLTVFDGYYAIVADVADNGDVYFIANSEKGSALYRYGAGGISRALAADNIVDARLISDEEVLIAAIGKDAYYYTREQLQTLNEAPFVVSYFWDEPAEDNTQVAVPVDSEPQPILIEEPEELAPPKAYRSLAAMRYSGGSVALASDEDNRSVYDLSFHFADPLNYNNLSFWAARDGDLSDLIGIRYSNNQYFLQFAFNAYYLAKTGFYDHTIKPETRDGGYNLDLKLPFIRQGYWQADLSAGYALDYKKPSREPKSLSLNLSYQQAFGHTLLANKEAALSLYHVNERGDHIEGASLRLSTDLPKDFYIGLAGKYAQSDQNAVWWQYRGVKLNDGINSFSNDPSEFSILSLKRSYYAKRGAQGEVFLTQVWPWSKYHFGFPVSLRRVAFTGSYRHYDFSQIAGLGDAKIDQIAFRVAIDLSILNVLNLVLAPEIQINDKNAISDRYYFNVGLGFAF